MYSNLQMAVLFVGMMATFQTGLAADGTYWLYVGNNGKHDSFDCFAFDPATGKITGGQRVGEGVRMNFLAVDPEGKYLYAVSPGKVRTEGGEVRAFAVDRATGDLTFLNAAHSGGQEPAHLAVDPSGKVLAVANYSGKSFALLKIADDGRVIAPTADGGLMTIFGSSVNPHRQAESHPHGVAFNAKGDQILMADLGTDKIYACGVDAAKGTLLLRGSSSVPPGSGPRHVVYGKTEKFAYVINELSRTVSAFSVGENGLEAVQTVDAWPAIHTETQPDASTAAEIQMSADGRFVYVSNRGRDSIAVLAIDSATGKLTPVEAVQTGGKTPRGFVIDPTGRWLIVGNQGSDTMTVFGIDAATGKLTSTGQVVKSEAPVSMVFIARR